MTQRMKKTIVGTSHVDLAKRSPRVHLSSRARPGIHRLRIRSGMYACNGILFNHESPRRGETFVTRKITRGLANISQGLEDCLFIGNIDALRDWGHAKDYVRMQWMMLQQDKPDDFVIATGVQYSVRQFIEWTATELGMQLRWEGTGVNEVGYWVNRHCEERSDAAIHDPGIVIASEARQSMNPDSLDCHVVPPRNDADRPIVRIDPRYFRPTEVETLLGDPSKAKQKLGWVPEITAQEMCAEMVAHDLAEAKKHALLMRNGYKVNVSVE
jgi:GDPmannose 4,6-dehydratase